MRKATHDRWLINCAKILHDTQHMSGKTTTTMMMNRGWIKTLFHNRNFRFRARWIISVVNRTIWVKLHNDKNDVIDLNLQRQKRELYRSIETCVSFSWKASWIIDDCLLSFYASTTSTEISEKGHQRVLKCCWFSLQMRATVELFLDQGQRRRHKHQPQRQDQTSHSKRSRVRPTLPLGIASTVRLAS